MAVALIRLHDMRPMKFAFGLGNAFATWRNGACVACSALTALLRSAFKRGLNHGAYSLHSIRGGGATSLYLATRDVELVARVGRWRTKSISAYLRDSHQMLDGMGNLLVANQQTPHRATKRLGGDWPTASVGGAWVI